MKGGFFKWRVALACAFIYFLHRSQMKIMGLQFVATLDRYNVDRAQASFPYVLRFIVAQLSGPFVGYLSCKLGLQRVILSGCFLSSIAIGSCFFAENILVVTLCWGILYGLGSGMAGHLLPAYMSLHFTKDLARANGLALAGISLGGFAYPSLYEYLLDEYGTSGAFLVLSAYTLNSVVSAFVLAISQDNSKQTPKRKNSITKECGLTKSELVSLVSKGDEPNTANGITLLGEHYQNKKDVKMTVLDHKQMSSENTNLPSQEINKIDSVAISPVLSKTGTKILERKLSSSIIPKEEAVEMLSNVASSEEESPKLDGKQESNIWKVLSVFYNPLFILTTITQSSFLFVLTLHSTVVVDFARDKGATVNQTVYLLMSSAIAELAGYLSLGWITDKGWISTTNFAALCYFCFGLSVTVFAVFGEYIVLLVSLAFGSFVTGGQLLTFPVIVSQYFDKEDRNVAMASRYILFVPMSFTSSPLIGFFRDGLGSYEWLFYFLHIFSFFSSILFLLMPFVARRKIRRSQERNDFLNTKTYKL